MKKSLLLAILAITTLCAKSQQDPQLTMWQFDRVSFNPAAVSMNGMNNFTFFHRDQWDGFDHDPKTYLLNLESVDPIGFSKNKGFGLNPGVSFFQEVLGQQQNTMVRFNFSFAIPLSNGNVFSIAPSLGMYQSKLGSNWIYIDPDDPTIPDSETSSSTFDGGLGVTFHRPGQYYIGLSATHLNGGELKTLNIKTAQHFYAMGGYEYELPSGSIRLRPNVLVKTDFNATQFDINMDALWNNTLWGGLAFRPGDAIAPYVGFQKSFAPKSMSPTKDLCEHGIKIGYSYDVTTSDIKDYSAGSHEIFLTYSFKFCPIIIKAKNHDPRFL